MRIGIDISQIVYEGTGVATYVRSIVREIISKDTENEYVLFGSSLRRRRVLRSYHQSLHADPRRVTLKLFFMPPTFLDLLWNRLHIIPIESFIGPVDIFWSSDWTQPPLAGARGITTIHDLIAFKYPIETHEQTEFTTKRLLISPNIVATQKRRLAWVKKECQTIFCDSESTKKDVMGLLGIAKDRLHVVYPGFSGNLL
ncbi:MAG TPA: glycosyltransferase [Patescibacteria group bacterium]|nr:glycosyltransferase [Patescibacteria group bacterium]